MLLSYGRLLSVQISIQQKLFLQTENLLPLLADFIGNVVKYLQIYITIRPCKEM